MSGELGLSNAALDGLFRRARAFELAGRLDGALSALTVAVAELASRGEAYPCLFEWMAQLESALGHHEAAEQLALLGRELATGADRTAEVLRMDVLRARIAREALELERAEVILAELRSGDVALGAPIPARLEPIIDWLRALAFPGASARDLAMLRAEAALAIIELWAERGRYRSALRLLDAIAPSLPDARGTVRADQVQLLRAELLAGAGDLAGAHAALERIPPQDTTVDRGRVALVRVRVALVGGQLSRALPELSTLEAVPTGDPMLFASAVAARVAVLAELNELEPAARIAAEAGDALAAAGAPPRAAAELIERARLDAAVRGRSVIALWELPHTVGGAALAMPLPPASEPAGTRWRLTTAWTAAANAVLLALERGDRAAAAAEQARLEALARGIESAYVEARVALSGSFVAYDAGGGDAGELLAIAGRLRELGARLAEAQAVRLAGWLAARHRRYGDHAALARRASAIVDEIAAELEPARRVQFLRNKWSGRDELAEQILRALLGGGAAPSRRDLCRAFGEIDRLTHHPVDDALGEHTTEPLPRDATNREVRAWLDRDRVCRRARRARTAGLAIRSAWSLWRVPARTLILHYHVLPDRTFLFRIARRYIDVRILPYGRVHFALDMREAADDDEQLRCLAEVTGVAEALASFPRTDRLVIVPHDVIAGVPFAALLVGKRRLCELGSIVQVDRIGRLRRRAWRRRAPGRMLSVGRTRYGGALPDLPSAELEATVVAKLAGGEPLLDATRRGVLEALPRVARLHVAAHGLFDAAAPAQSGIVLGREAGAGRGHETLTLRELRELDLSALRLATLATCRSAEHARLPGRERVCLPTALLDAGARGVIASLWPVEDAPSIEVMRALYAELRDHHPAVALARTQAALAGRLPARQWAGLVFYGNE